MKIIDIENLTADELKARRDEAIAAAKEADDVAERYVQARHDAKKRDEKLAEQGRTIATLQDAADAAKARIAELQQAHASLSKATASANERASAALEAAEAKIADLTEQLNAAMARVGKFEGLSKRRREALVGVLNHVTPLLADEQN